MSLLYPVLSPIPCYCRIRINVILSFLWRSPNRSVPLKCLGFVIPAFRTLRPFVLPWLYSFNIRICLIEQVVILPNYVTFVQALVTSCGVGLNNSLCTVFRNMAFNICVFKNGWFLKSVCPIQRAHRSPFFATPVNVSMAACYIIHS